MFSLSITIVLECLKITTYTRIPKGLTLENVILTYYNIRIKYSVNMTLYIEIIKMIEILT